MRNDLRLHWQRQCHGMERAAIGNAILAPELEDEFVREAQAFAKRMPRTVDDLALRRTEWSTISMRQSNKAMRAHVRKRFGGRD